MLRAALVLGLWLVLGLLRPAPWASGALLRAGVRRYARRAVPAASGRPDGGDGGDGSEDTGYASPRDQDSFVSVEDAPADAAAAGGSTPATAQAAVATPASATVTPTLVPAAGGGTPTHPNFLPALIAAKPLLPPGEQMPPEPFLRDLSGAPPEPHATTVEEESDAEVVKLNSALEAVKEDIMSTSKQIAEERKWRAAVSKITTSYEEKMKRVEEHVVGLRKEMKKLYQKKKQIENLKLQHALESKLKEAAEELTTLQNSLKHVQQKNSDLSRSHSELQQTINSIESQLSALKGEQQAASKAAAIDESPSSHHHGGEEESKHHGGKEEPKHHGGEEEPTHHGGEEDSNHHGGEEEPKHSPTF